LRQCRFKKKNTNGIVGSFEKQAIPVDVFELSDTDSHPRNPKIVFWVFFSFDCVFECLGKTDAVNVQED